MQTINFDDGQQVKAEVLRLIKDGKLVSLADDYNYKTRAKSWSYVWGDAEIKLSVTVQTNGYSLFLDLAFSFPRPMCPIKVNKSIIIPVVGEIKPTAPMLEVLTKSIEAYEPGN